MNLGRVLIVIGIACAGLGVLILLVSRLGIPLGRLPGDIVVRREHSTFYFPWVTCLVLSVVISLIFWLLNRRH